MVRKPVWTWSSVTVKFRPRSRLVFTGFSLVLTASISHRVCSQLSADRWPIPLQGQFKCSPVSRLLEPPQHTRDGGGLCTPLTQTSLRQVLLRQGPPQPESPGQPPGLRGPVQEPGRQWGLHVPGAGPAPGPPQEDRHWLDVGALPGPLLGPGVPQCSDVPGHRPLTDLRLHLPAPAPGCRLSQYRLKALRPQTSLLVQAGHLHRLQRLSHRASEHGDVGPPEAALGAVRPDLPGLSLPAALPAGAPHLSPHTEDDQQAVRDLPHVGGHGVQVL